MTVTKVISMGDAVRIPRVVGNALKAAAKAASAEIVIVILNACKTATKRAGAKAEGTYLKSWRVVRRGATGIVVENVAPHAGFVEGGRGPSSKGPPPAKILAWVKKKLGISDNRLAVRAAILIGRKIKRHGIKGRAILAAAMKASKPRIDRIIKKHFDAAMKKSNV